METNRTENTVTHLFELKVQLQWGLRHPRKVVIFYFEKKMTPSSTKKFLKEKGYEGVHHEWSTFKLGTAYHRQE